MTLAGFAQHKFSGLVALALALFSTGCGRSFFLRESDSAALAQNVRTASLANEQLARLQGKTITVQFDSSGAVPRIQSTNLLQTLRETTNLVIADDFFHQISLAGISGQIEHQADNWASERLALLQQSGGHEVRLKELRQVTIQVLSPPVLSYDAGQQAVTFQTTVRLELTGKILVNVDTGILGPILDLFRPSPTGEWTIDVVVDNYALQGQLRLSNPFRDASLVRLQVQPQIGNLSVNGNGPSDVNEGVRRLLSQALSGKIDTTQALDFKNFSIADASVQPGSPENTLSLTYLPRPRRSEAVLDVVARGDDNVLYHAQRKGNAWGDFLPLPSAGAFTGDPSLAAAGAQLELVAVHTDGALYNSQRRGRSWSPWHKSIPPGHRFVPQKPALLATAPGQWEAIAVAEDGSLWHVRRWNGALIPAAPVPHNSFVAPPQLPFRDPAVAQVGSKMVLLFVDGRNLLYGASFDLETGHWSLSSLITTQGNVQFAPTVASCGGGRLEVVYAGTGGHPHHRFLLPPTAAIPANYHGNGFDVGDELDIGGTLSASPALTCSGYQQMELMGRGTDNIAYSNHFVGPFSAQGAMDGRQIQPGWQGWSEMDARFFGTIISAAVAPALAPSSTSRGEVFLVTRQNGTAAAPLLFNAQDTRRFGRTEWITIGWRGLEQLGTHAFLGTPALAVRDRSVEVWSTDSEATIHGIALAERGATETPGLASSTVGLALPAAVLSSAPGELDILSLDAQGNLHFSRSLNEQNYAQFPLGRPGNSSIFSMAAVSPGPGIIDVVTVSSDRTLHHWRKLHDHWLAPATISGTVISAPVLLATGAGQMELLAIGGDHKLYRWRYANGQWTSWQQIPGSLQLSTMFSQLSASSSGDGIVDLAVIEDSTRVMFHLRTFPPIPQSNGSLSQPANSGFSSIGGRASDVALMLSLGPDQLAVFARGTDGYLYENWSRLHAPHRRRGGSARGRLPRPTLTWPGFRPLTDSNAVFGGLALLPEGEIAVLAEKSGGLVLNRRSQDQWSGFWFLPRASNQAPFRPPVLAY
jgi:hypothetical protein